MCRLERYKDDNCTPCPFLLTSFLLFLSSAMLLAVYLGSVPFTSTDTTEVGRMSTSTWLVLIKAQDSAVTPSTDPSLGPSSPDYGFGVSGWCEWDGTYVAPTNGSAPPMYARCNEVWFWSLPGDANAGDSIVALNLPP